jgi:hypothetical protein
MFLNSPPRKIGVSDETGGASTRRIQQHLCDSRQYSGFEVKTPNRCQFCCRHLSSLQVRHDSRRGLSGIWRFRKSHQGYAGISTSQKSHLGASYLVAFQLVRPSDLSQSAPVDWRRRNPVGFNMLVVNFNPDPIRQKRGRWRNRSDPCS